MLYNKQIREYQNKDMWKICHYDWQELSNRITLIVVATMINKNIPRYLLEKYFGNKILEVNHDYTLKEISRLEIFLGIRFIYYLAVVRTNMNDRRTLNHVLT